jgi:hexosaminidase
MTRTVLAAWFVITAVQAAALQPLPIVPRPAVVRHLNGTFLLGRSAVIHAEGSATPVATWFARQIESEFGIPGELAAGPARGKAFRFVVDQSLPEEGYRLRIDPRGVTIAGRPAGLFYGAQSVLQLAAAHSGATFILPAAEIED